MTAMLRGAALLIAIAGVIDPAITMAGRARARVALLVQDGPTMALPASDGGSRRSVGERVRDRLARDLGDRYDLQPRLTSDAAAAIVIGDRYDTLNVPLAATVSVGGDLSPNVGIVRVAAPREVPAGTAMRIGVDVEALGMAGKSSTVVLRTSDIELARVSHTWQSDRERWEADLDAIPVGRPPFILRAEVEPAAGERTDLDNLADAVVDLRRAPLRVEVYEPRPSWATTFLRRALEADPRFQVAALTVTAKRGTAPFAGVAVRTGDAAPLTGADLDARDVVVVGGLDRLTDLETRALERFVRERGGAVVLVPDSRILSAAARDLLRGITLTERLSERPATLTAAAPLPPILASELLLIGGEDPLAERIAWTAGADAAPLMLSWPRGSGRLVFSGALDAWRFRAENDAAFDRFWQSAIAGLALAVRPPLDVGVEPAILAPGQRSDVIVRAGPHVNGAGISADVDGRPIRLWPDPERGAFRGSFTAPDTEGRSVVTVHTGGSAPMSARRSLVVSGDAHQAMPLATAPLSLLSASHGGIDVAPGRIAELARFVRARVAAPPATVTRRPMRSAWWMIPFASCLCAEWFLRRRRGLR